MYSSDRMKTLIRIVKDYNKNIVSYQMYFLNIYLSKEILLIFFHHFVDFPAKNQPLLDYFLTLAEVERDSKELQLNSAWVIVRL